MNSYFQVEIETHLKESHNTKNEEMIKKLITIEALISIDTDSKLVSNNNNNSSTTTQTISSTNSLNNNIDDNNK